VTSDVFFDPLLDSLEILTRLHGTPHSAESLKAGMPLVDNKFTFDVFMRSARRAGLSSRLLKRTLKNLGNRINITTIGGVVRAGMTLMEIVPLEDKLVIEARLFYTTLGFSRYRSSR